MKNKIITVVGSGYVGTTTATLLASAGFKTFILDIDDSKIKKLLSGKASFFEKGLNSLINQALTKKLLLPTSSYKDSISQSDIVISAIGTPEASDGSMNLDFIFNSIKDIASESKGPLLYIQKSTVPAGTGNKIISEYSKLSPFKITYVSAPEFLREGSAVNDSIEPDRIVAGGGDIEANELAINVFYEMYKNRKNISKIAGVELLGKDEPKIFNTSLESAELSKVTSNAFLALKISFANSIAMFAELVGADVVKVMDIVGSDNRIGRSFLNAGRGYGGGCFPKDVQGLIVAADKVDVSLDIMKSAVKVNDIMPEYIIKKLGKINNKTVGVLGLAFKAGTSDVRESPGVKIANKLNHLGATVSVYDPEAGCEARSVLDPAITIADSIDDLISVCEVVIIATEWPEFKNINLKKLKSKTIVDAVNMLDPVSVKSLGIDYFSVGR